MRVRYSPYKLQGKGAFPSRRGALLEFAFEDGSVGYADCHPWPELGDAPIEKQLASLYGGHLTPLTSRSLDFAMLDAEGRSQKRNLFEGLTVPKCHYLALSKEIPGDFEIYKCKSPRVCLDLLPNLSWGQKVRMDFNFKLTSGQFMEFMGRIQSYAHVFDYIEDPFRFNHHLWSACEKQFSIPLALDRAKQGEEYPLRVLKPAVDVPVQVKNEGIRYIYTSYLDHPFGQLTASYAAAISGTQEVCGLITHHVYEENAFSRRFSIDNGVFAIPMEGYGFGFDDCLSKLSWSKG